MANDPHWIEKMTATMKTGALHKMLGVPAGTKIPLHKLIKAAHSGKPLEKKRAVAAENMRGGR